MISASFPATYHSLPDSIKNLIDRIVIQLDPDEIVLFGSRARGDHRLTSDFDIAVKATPLRMPAWTRLQGDLQDEPITLYQVDLVDYNELSDEYKKRISREGKLLYARQSK